MGASPGQFPRSRFHGPISVGSPVWPVLAGDGGPGRPNSGTPGFPTIQSESRPDASQSGAVWEDPEAKRAVSGVAEHASARRFRIAQAVEHVRQYAGTAAFSSTGETVFCLDAAD